MDLRCPHCRKQVTLNVTGQQNLFCYLCGGAVKMPEFPAIDVHATTPAGAPKSRYVPRRSSRIDLGLIVAFLIVPLAGLIAGGIYLFRGEKKGEAALLWGAIGTFLHASLGIVMYLLIFQYLINDAIINF